MDLMDFGQLVHHQVAVLPDLLVEVDDLAAVFVHSQVVVLLETDSLELSVAASEVAPLEV